MSYTTTGISILDSQPYDLGRIIRALVTHQDKWIQCYVSGRLVAWQQPVHGVVEFVLTEPADEDLVSLLAVDAADAGTNLWPEAFGGEPGRGSRILVQTPQHIAPFAPDDRWKVYRDEAGEPAATVLVHQQAFYPAGRHSGGWGKDWGYGGWGWSGYDGIGWGHNWGYGQWGFDCQMLNWTSEPLPPGDYPVKVTVEDAAGNESAAYETVLGLTTYPRPAFDLAIDSHDKQTDTVVLTFSPSPDEGPS